MSVVLTDLPPNLVATDDKGLPTLEFVILLQQIIRALRDHEARLETLEP